MQLFIKKFYLFCFISLFLSPIALAMQEDYGAGYMQLNSINKQVVEALLLNSKAHIEVSGLSARVMLTQIYKNTSSNWVEGIYLLPLPENAAIDTLRIKTQDTVIEGIIKEKKQAQAIYQQAKRTGKKASIINSERPDLFTTKVANIAPNSEILIEISYLQPVNFDNHEFSLYLPNTLTPRYIPRTITEEETRLEDDHLIAKSGWSSVDNITPPQYVEQQLEHPASSHQIEITANIHPGLELSSINSSSHKINWIKQHDGYQITLQQGSVAMNRDFHLNWQAKAESSPLAAVFSEQFAKDSYINLMVMPPQSVNKSEILPRDMIFVIDSSGSMKGRSIVQAKASLQKALQLLTAQDRFNIIEFNSSATLYYDQAKYANKNNIKHAHHIIESIQAGGGTEINQALMLAMSQPVSENHLKQIIFITDGSIGNEQEIFQTIQSELGDSRLFTIAIGSAPNMFFMRKSAAFGRGSSIHIANLRDIDKSISQLFSKLKSPVLKDISIRWEDNSSVEYYPNPIPDLYLGQPLLIHAKIPHNSQSGKADTQVSHSIEIKGMLKNKPWSRSISYQLHEQTNGLAKLWARSKIANLMDQSVSGVPESQIREQVVPLAIKHGLVSKYTSLVAVDTKPEREQKEQLKTHKINNLMPKGSTMNVPFPKTATNAQLLSYLGLALILMAGFARRSHIKGLI